VKRPTTTHSALCMQEGLGQVRTHYYHFMVFEGYTDNEKLGKVAATKKTRALHGARGLIGEQDKVQEGQVSSGVMW
jgi:hypothetical protein